MYGFTKVFVQDPLTAISEHYRHGHPLDSQNEYLIFQREYIKSHSKSFFLPKSILIATYINIWFRKYSHLGNQHFLVIAHYYEY